MLSSLLKERSSSVKELPNEWFGSSSSNTAFSALSFDGGFDEDVGMLMLVMNVYDGACIFLIHDGGEREVGVRISLIYGGGTSLLTLRRGV